MPKTLGIWEWGCPKRGDAHITKTAAYLYSQAIYTGRPGLDFVSQSTDINLPHLWPASGRQGWITYYACPWHHLFTCLARARTTRAKWNSCNWDHFIFDHLLNSYLWMPTKEKLYEYVRNATHGKKCYVIQGSRKMFLTVPARFLIVLMQIVSKFAERWLRN